MHKQYRSTEEMLRAENPKNPVYCIYPNIYQRSTKKFIDGFPGRVLYAVKANDHPDVVKVLYESGIRHFDCASIPEIKLIRDHCPDAKCYFINPVRIPGHAGIAQHEYGVRHFIIDHISGLAPLIDEIDPLQAVIFSRMAVSHASAMQDLSYKFGGLPEDIPSLLCAISDSGAEPALAFNVGTSVTSPDAYTSAMVTAREVLAQLPFQIRMMCSRLK